MEEDIRKLSIKQYFRYFRIWFVLLAIVLTATIVLGVRHSMKPVEKQERANLSAPAERVYDYAEILTDEEEDNLRRRIALAEKACGADFVIVTTAVAVEGSEMDPEMGFRYDNWDLNMRDLADNLWDEMGYGYNAAFEGDGSLLLDNRYPGQRGEWLSTSGKVEDSMGDYEIEAALNAVDEYYDDDPYQAYCAYVDYVYDLLREPTVGDFSIIFCIIMAVAAVIALIYGCVNYHQSAARDTVTPDTYLDGQNPDLYRTKDTYLRKVVTKKVIDTNSGSGGGGGGHHTSRSGASHGGGGHRH